MMTQSLPCPPIELLDLASGYQQAKTLFLLIEFALPTLLSPQPLNTEQIARSLGMHTRAADSFLRACVALGLLDQLEGEYRNSALAELFLVKGKSTYLGDEFARYDRTSYPMWMNLGQKLRQWQPGGTDSEIPQQLDQGPLGIRARHNLSLMVGSALSETFNFSAHRTMLDLGGGTGAMSLSICERHRDLRAIVFDLPLVTEVASELIREKGFSDRIEVIAGNFKTDELPSQFDVALLANLLSVAGEETNRKLLKRIYDRLPVGGAVILSGYILDDGVAGPLIPVLFCLQDIGWEAPDVERDSSTYSGWLEEAGFVEIERKMFCPPTSMIIGRKR
jgi:predicted O-methyltransferase YrrM